MTNKPIVVKCKSNELKQISAKNFWTLGNIDAALLLLEMSKLLLLKMTVGHHPILEYFCLEAAEEAAVVLVAVVAVAAATCHASFLCHTFSSVYDDRDSNFQTFLFFSVPSIVRNHSSYIVAENACNSRNHYGNVYSTICLAIRV